MKKIIFLMLLSSVCYGKLDSAKSILSSTQACTTSWANIGDQFTMLASDHVSVFVDYTILAASDLQMRGQALLDKDSTVAYTMALKSNATSSQPVVDGYYALPTADTKIAFGLTSDIDAPFVQLQTKCQTGTQSAAVFNDLSIVKSSNGLRQ